MNKANLKELIKEVLAEELQQLNERGPFELSDFHKENYQLILEATNALQKLYKTAEKTHSPNGAISVIGDLIHHAFKQPLYYKIAMQAKYADGKFDLS